MSECALPVDDGWRREASVRGEVEPPEPENGDDSVRMMGVGRRSIGGCVDRVGEGRSPSAPAAVEYGLSNGLG